MSKPLSRLGHELISVRYLISYHDHFKSLIDAGLLTSECKANEIANIIEGLFFNFFFNHRKNIPLRKPLPSMTIQNTIRLIEEGLELIYFYRPNLLIRDWRGIFLVNENPEDKIDEY